MAEQFTPLTPGSLPVAASFTSICADAPTAGSAPFRSLPAQPAEGSADSCGQPAVTLQRNTAGIVTAIRVQCGCGRVTELNCVY